MTGYLRRPGSDERITLAFTHKSLGHYENLAGVLPGAGAWTVHLEVRVDDLTSYATEQTLLARG